MIHPLLCGRQLHCEDSSITAGVQQECPSCTGSFAVWQRVYVRACDVPEGRAWQRRDMPQTRAWLPRAWPGCGCRAWLPWLLWLTAGCYAAASSPEGGAPASGSSVPQCHWVAARALECHVRTLDDAFAAHVTQGAWAAPPSPPGSEWPQDQGGPVEPRGKVRGLRSLKVECSRVLLYQSRLSAGTLRVRRGWLVGLGSMGFGEVVAFHVW